MAEAYIRKSKRFGMLCTIPGLTVVACLIIYPVFFNFYASFLKYDNISPKRFIALGNYQSLLASEYSDFPLGLKISAIYSVSSATLSTLTGLILAQILYSIRKGKGLFRTVALFSWGAPLVIASFIWKWIFSKDLGILNYLLSPFIEQNVAWLTTRGLALLTGIVTTTWEYTPFAMVIILAGLESIDPGLLEAAIIDGAAYNQILWRIMMPLNRHQLVVAFTIIWMFTFRTPDVLFSLTSGGPGKNTYHLGILLADMIYRYVNFGNAGALGVLLFLTTAAIAAPLLYYGIIRPSRK
jgi:multiple sugar transport system permease protein